MNPVDEALDRLGRNAHTMEEHDQRDESIATVRQRLAEQDKELEQRMTRESGRALIEDAQRWQRAYEKARDQVAEQDGEIQRLREERDMARAGRDQAIRDAKGRGVVQYELLARAESAEARVADLQYQLVEAEEWKARVRALQDGLREIEREGRLRGKDKTAGSASKCASIARALLASSEDSETGGGGAK